ncbi:hypothetical protein TNCV_3409311 [Trichonephila clavipes]|nr:hypothetical protein TNCV_3409311 [Trichonephila clavipes]
MLPFPTYFYDAHLRKRTPQFEKRCLKTLFFELKLFPNVLLSHNGLGCSRLVVKVSDQGWHVTSSSPVPLKSRRKSPKGPELAKNGRKHDRCRQNDPPKSSKVTPTWLYRQDFAKLPLNHQYNVNGGRKLFGRKISSVQKSIMLVSFSLDKEK